MKNLKFNRAKALHKQIESILLDCQEFSNEEQYPLIIDGLSKVNTLLNELEIKFIKDLQEIDNSSKLV